MEQMAAQHSFLAASAGIWQSDYRQVGGEEGNSDEKRQSASVAVPRATEAL